MAKSSEEKLRRELEILRAQVKSGTIGTKTVKIIEKENPSAGTPTKTANLELNYKAIQEDLSKTVIFSFFVIVALLALYITQNTWLPLIKFL